MFAKILLTLGLLLALLVIIGSVLRTHVKKEYLHRGAVLPKRWQYLLKPWAVLEWALVGVSLVGWAVYLLRWVWS